MKRYLPGRSGGVGLDVKGGNPESSNSVNRIVATLYDGRTIAKGVTTQAVLAGATYVTVTIPNLNFIEEILNVQVHTDPSCSISGFGNKNISGKVVGITIAGVDAGTTLTLEIIAVGV
ncbi:unnamed protein product [marine sediment metagenome]|uniref:Uncharacterized protein n=1 Tax=marine sediment metagenome TaxID=412755 RepID=X1FU07_9ZZZZ